MSTAIVQTTLTSKLMEIQSKLKAPKSQFNKFGNYAYRNQEDILEAVKPLLKEYGLILTLSDEVIAYGGELSPVHIRVTAKLTDGSDIITTTAVAREANEQKGMNPAQISGSTSSYARKYALNGLFLIDDTRDDDATNTHGKDKPEEKKEAPKAKFLKTEAVVEVKEKNTPATPEEAPKKRFGGFASKAKVNTEIS